jgi:outer membrane protein assembly factor BamB
MVSIGYNQDETSPVNPSFRELSRTVFTMKYQMMNSLPRHAFSLRDRFTIASCKVGLAMMAIGGFCNGVQLLQAGDWAHWRGPQMNGVSSDRNLPDSLDLKGDSLIWRKEEYATRSSPVVMDGKMYVVCRAFPESTQEGEKTVCLDAMTGDLIWESIHNVFLSDAPAERVGWSSVIADPASGNVYVLGLGCVFQCLDGKTGKILWEKSMSEEYGMLSTYGGRTNFPTVFEDLVIVSGVMTGWAEAAVPAHRFLAFDKKTGEAAWMLSTKLRPEDTTYSTPVFATFNGQAAMVFGGGDGAVYAVQPRTGKVIWQYQASTRGLNVTPVVDEKGIVYCGHSERNASDPNKLGAVFAFDGNREGVITEEQLLWKVLEKGVGRSCPVKVGDRIYFVEDGAAMLCLDAATGKVVGQKKLGRVMFGSPVYGDGKLYIAENNGICYVLKPTEKGVDVVKQSRLPINKDGQAEEVFGSCIIWNSRVYLPSTSALYCFGKKSAQPASEPVTSPWKETPADADKTVAQIQLVPSEMMLAPGQEVKLQVKGFNKLGQFVKLLDNAEYSLTGGEGKVEKGIFKPAVANAAGIKLTAKVGELTSTSRVRVIPKLPWSFDFNDGKIPPVWIGAEYRYKPAEVGGEKVLVKVSTIPKGTRSQGWMGWTDLHDYTVQADFMAKDQSERLPDMGLINQRYTLDLRGDQGLQIRSWTSRLELRFAKTIPFTWKSGEWISMKFQSVNSSDGVTLRGKVWKRGEKEPVDWQIEATDKTPNKNGSPGIFGNSTNAEFYLDNVKVVPNKP